MSTPWAPFIAVSCTPLYPFCPRTSQICIAISTSAAGWPRLKLRFETFVPIVVMYSSEYWSTTNRRIRDVFPTPPSPRRTILAFIDSEAMSFVHLRCPFIKRSVPFSRDEVLDQPGRSYLDAPLRWSGSEVFGGILRERSRGHAEFLEEGAGCDISAQGEGHRRIGDRSVQFVPESPESLLVLPGRDPVHARETVWSTRLSERNGLAEVPDLGRMSSSKWTSSWRCVRKYPTGCHRAGRFDIAAGVSD